MAVLEILDVDELSKKIDVKFKTSLTWQDERLSFVNLNTDKETLMSKREASLIWLPRIFLDDVDQYSRFVQGFRFFFLNITNIYVS